MTGTVIPFPVRAAKPANDNRPEPTPPGLPALSLNWPLHAMAMIEKFAVIVASRPNYKPDRHDSLALRNPACEHACDKCYMQCAVAPDRLAWWEGELAKACGTRAVRQIGRA